MQVCEIKVSSKSNPNSVAGAIAGMLKEKETLIVKTIGAGAVNQAMKAIAIARSFLIVQGTDIICSPSFYQTEINGDEISAISLNVKRIKA